MSGILQIVRSVVHSEVEGAHTSLFGIVSAVFPHSDAGDDNNFEVNVRLKHEDVELRKVPVMVSNIGAAAIPAEGDLVLVQFVNGELNQPIIAGRFYHADARPPLHKDDEIVFEHRVTSDGTINQLHFANDGSIYLQRDVSKPENNSQAKAGIAIDGASGDITIQAGDKTTIVLKNDGDIQVTSGGKIQFDAGSNDVKVTCGTMTVNGKLVVDGDAEVDGVLKAAHSGGSTTIDGHGITGA